MIKGTRRSPHRRQMPSRAFLVIVIVALLAASGFFYFYLFCLSVFIQNPCCLFEDKSLLFREMWIRKQLRDV